MYIRASGPGEKQPDVPRGRHRARRRRSRAARRARRTASSRGRSIRGREGGRREGGAQKKQSPWQSLLIVTCSHQRWGRVGASYPWRASAGPRCAAGRTRAPRAREPPRPVAERRPRIPSLNEPPSSLQGARRQWHHRVLVTTPVTKTCLPAQRKRKITSSHPIGPQGHRQTHRYDAYE